MIPKRRAKASKTEEERRKKLNLRELLDELIGHVRGVANRSHEMTQEELEYAQERLEWLADEIWATALRDEDSQNL